jgi:hypothetical protein
MVAPHLAPHASRRHDKNKLRGVTKDGVEGGGGGKKKKKEVSKDASAPFKNGPASTAILSAH